MSRPLLEVPFRVYRDLIADLARSGAGVNESGAFLLGQVEGAIRKASSYIMYDSVAISSSQRHAYVSLSGAEMAIAWERCYASGLQVVADIHTHPMGPAQSVTDRSHPIVSIAGHVALIAPYFAMQDPMPIDLGVHIFHGSGRWKSLFHQAAERAIRLT